MQQVPREPGLRSRPLAPYLAPTGPDFETKAADIIGLPRAFMLRSIASTRRPPFKRPTAGDPVLPLAPDRILYHRFEYRRQGTASLYTALNVPPGEPHGKRTARHMSQDLVASCGEVVAIREPKEELHVIAGHLSANKTKTVAAFPQRHTKGTSHFRPTHWSRLSPAALWPLKA